MVVFQTTSHILTLLRMYCSMMQQILVEQWKHLNMDNEGEKIRITLAHALGRVSIHLLFQFQILILADWFFVNSKNHISTWAKGKDRLGYAGEREDVTTVCTIQLSKTLRYMTFEEGNLLMMEFLAKK